MRRRNSGEYGDGGGFLGIGHSSLWVSTEPGQLHNILRLAPPESEVGGWTSTILYVLGDGGVFEGWHRTITDAGEVGTQEEKLSDRERDRLIVRICAAATLPDPIPNIPPDRSARILSVLAEVRPRTPGPLILITRDAQLTREAIAAGVDAATPEAFAARTMTTAQARDMWCERVTMAINRYVARGALDGWLLRIRAMDRVRMLVDAGWHPLG